jgi:hypothetical protein
LEQLQQFALRASSVSRAQRHRSLAVLRSTLAEGQASLYESEGTDGTLRCKPGVAAAAWRLVGLSSELGDGQLAVFAGELLALVGPLDPRAVAFDASMAARSGPLAPQRGDAGEGLAPPSVSGVWPAALSLLAEYLVDEDVFVNRLAQRTARLLLATPEGKKALLEMPTQDRQYVEIFEPTSQEAATSEPMQAGMPAPDDPVLWNLEGVGYEVWVCDLAAAMMCQVGQCYAVLIPGLHAFMYRTSNVVVSASTWFGAGGKRSAAGVPPHGPRQAGVCRATSPTCLRGLGHAVV